MNDKLGPPPTEVQKTFFRPVCTEEEIERIFDLKNAKDYLLKVRAETIVDHMRLYRVYRNKAMHTGDAWTLEKSFNDSHYTNFINALEPELKQKCQSITAGNIFSTDANGFAFNTDYGRVITISDSLQFFLKFMHLGLLNVSGNVPVHVALNSVQIALRVMFRSEALDFYMDPRGILPRFIAKAIHAPIPAQMQFIAGHEYAHHILGHVPDKKEVKRPILRAIFKSQDDYGIQKVYNYSQISEFEADINSITLAKRDVVQRKEIIEAALLWFACLEVYETVSDVISPQMGFSTHPPARDRFNNIIDKLDMTGINHHKWQKVIDRAEMYKNFLVDDVGFHTEHYEIYGSLYLDKPNTKWRGRELIDRKDYY